MITVQNGKLTIPEHERFIGFAGENLVRKVEFLFKGQKKADPIYRIFLTFDDGVVNCFTLPSKVTDEGVVLTWDVKREQIFKSGNVTVQIKSYSENGLLSYTSKDMFMVGNSAEFSDYLHDNNTEFLEYEQKLNELIGMFREVSVLMPYIGDNGHWFYFDSEKVCYVDSGIDSVGKADSTTIGQGAVTSENIALGAIDREELFSQEMIDMYLSMPVKKVNVPGDIADDFYNEYTSAGIYQIDTYSGQHQVLVVLRPSSDAYLMQVLFCYDKVTFRGIYCSEDGVYADDDWLPWVNLSHKGMKDASEFYEALSLGKEADPCFLAYQTNDVTTDKYVRIPMSLLRNHVLSIEDQGEYFVSETIEGALQELGAELRGVSSLLSQI